MKLLNFQAIGVIRTPFANIENMPIQPTGGKGVKGEVEILNPFVEGLDDLDGFSHIILIYHFHQTKKYELKVIPFMDDSLRGVFSTRAPKRPNPIGLSVVRLVKIENNVLYVEDVDILDGTPLLDIKPFIPDVDSPRVDKLGWLQGKTDQMKQMKSDKRF
ncbi:MAG: tRNA (N6-threonylcarbamoyladenosine(37)-N6)-methyltransferase TrmO [Bacteroidales bacterium]|jgi:tRNA-Thr(GGU) m(6)t(6)A37 methyltransferase TsaA|nr:tRNA (N6-threonylcarbamoyladenosine(37)-N6)-methyltransferase TrmO [Bacteroidales bacterium]